jgi:alkanesulfonate monooxygenase SsuD/methylene tetrahydromethanopterin reductase-like flavin-dependent oxidoreductase (luciferase family)
MGMLARETRQARLLILGNPIANRREPVRVAEEMAMVDVYSRGRLECGFVRGVPYEMSAGNHRPTRMMERFWEAHDLIVKAWTTHDGPFNWEGKYFHHRQVNIWPRPYQDPHPPIWVTALSPSSARDVGEKGYVVACFLTGFDGTKLVFDTYRARRAELGLPAPAPDRFAYAALVYTGETDEEGRAGARKLMWYLESNKVPPQFTSPPGYHPTMATVNAMKGVYPGIFKMFQNPTLEGLTQHGLVFAGNPDTVYRQIMQMHEHVGGFGHLLIMGQAGFLDHDETVKGMEMFVREVYPRLKEARATA